MSGRDVVVALLGPEKVFDLEVEAARIRTHMIIEMMTEKACHETGKALEKFMRSLEIYPLPPPVWRYGKLPECFYVMDPYWTAPKHELLNQRESK